MYRIWK